MILSIVIVYHNCSSSLFETYLEFDFDLMFIKSLKLSPLTSLDIMFYKMLNLTARVIISQIINIWKCINLNCHVQIFIAINDYSESEEPIIMIIVLIHLDKNSTIIIEERL